MGNDDNTCVLLRCSRLLEARRSGTSRITPTAMCHDACRQVTQHAATSSVMVL